MRKLQKGSRGKDVRTLQGLLNKLGNRLVVDGKFGPATRDAVVDFQNQAGMTPDGVVGDETWNALQQRTEVSSASSAGGDDAATSIFDAADFSRLPTWDSHTDRRIGKLHHKVRDTARKFIILLERDMDKKLRVTSGFRSFAEQDALFARGRTILREGNKSVRKVTNARAGESYHNYGVAFDVVEIKNGKALWSNPDWPRIGELGIQLGFEWGGNWTSFKDRPHFQMTFGKKISELLSLHQAGRFQDGFVIVD
jgi:peptidoglycan L-alanyl-D-glutamate endopeptidase CwlK